jgi:hypothetical protein
MLKTWRFFTLVLAALSLTMESAHVLELPQKMHYDAQMYAAVNGTLYRYFAAVGGAYQLISIVLAIVLAILVRHRRPTFQWTGLGAFFLLCAFGVWLAVVQPVNTVVAAAVSVSPDTVPSLWTQLRGRWEYGHAAGFVLQLVGFCSLVVSILVDENTVPDARRTA